MVNEVPPPFLVSTLPSHQRHTIVEPVDYLNDCFTFNAGLVCGSVNDLRSKVEVKRAVKTSVASMQVRAL